MRLIVILPVQTITITTTIEYSPKQEMLDFTLRQKSAPFQVKSKDLYLHHYNIALAFLPFLLPPAR
jgi:hypothetical protein